MHETPDAAVAALNNAAWCAAVWRSHGLPVDQAHGLWFCARETPQYYPNVVTVDPEADTDIQTAFIVDLWRRTPPARFSVKDSFAKLDLSGIGLTPLFEGRWLVRPSRDGARANTTLQWRVIAEGEPLAAWESAWRGVDEGADRVFVDRLLLDPQVSVLGAVDVDGILRAGGIAYASAGVVGLTNIFGDAAQFVEAVDAFRPGRALVCYTPMGGLRSMEASGFERAGPLRVWVSPAA